MTLRSESRVNTTHGLHTLATSYYDPRDESLDCAIELPKLRQPGTLLENICVRDLTQIQGVQSS